MEFKEIQELIKIIDESNLTSFELEKEGFRLSLQKEVQKIYSREIVQQGVFTEPASGQMSAQALVQTSDMPKDRQTVDCPIVGTFYTAPSPGESPFVLAGSKVKKGDVLCIIEAMKLMNEIEAEEDLEILEVLATNGQMAEYGQPLFAVRQG